MSKPSLWTIRRMGKYEGGEEGIEILDGNGEVVADNQTYYPTAITQENADIIVNAVNNHETLVSALRSIKRNLRSGEWSVYHLEQLCDEALRDL